MASSAGLTLTTVIRPRMNTEKNVLHQRRCATKSGSRRAMRSIFIGLARQGNEIALQTDGRLGLFQVKVGLVQVAADAQQ